MRGLEPLPGIYDALLSLFEWLGFHTWRGWVAGGARGRSLDLGCGTGRNLPLFPRGTLAVGIDPNARYVAKARRRAPGALFVLARAEALPFRDGTFDTVVSGLAFCTVGDPAASFGEIRRVLTAGGSLRMLEHVRSRNRLLARLQDLAQPAWTRVAGGCHPNRDTERAAQDAGFVIEEDGRRARGALRAFQARPGTRRGPGSG
jgi:ubiquinone/menaquinone biosynthesis C-methylase UbiE